MASVFEKSFFAGLGALMYLQEKANDVVKDMIDKGRLAPDEGRRFMEDFDRRMRDDVSSVRKTVDEGVQSTLREAGFITKSDMEDIRGLLDDISGRLRKLEDAGPHHHHPPEDENISP